MSRSGRPARTCGAGSWAWSSGAACSPARSSAPSVSWPPGSASAARRCGRRWPPWRRRASSVGCPVAAAAPSSPRPRSSETCPASWACRCCSVIRASPPGPGWSAWASRRLAPTPPRPSASARTTSSSTWCASGSRTAPRSRSSTPCSPPNWSRACRSAISPARSTSCSTASTASGPRRRSSTSRSPPPAHWRPRSWASRPVPHWCRSPAPRAMPTAWCSSTRTTCSVPTALGSA